MRAEPSSPSGPARLAAVVAPALVVLAAGIALWLCPVNDRGVVNGKPRVGGAVAYIDHELSTRMPEVLVLGSSYAATNIDQPRLAAELGLPKRDVLVLAVPNSVCAHWYAMLEHRVYDAGHDVPLVVIVSSIAGLLQVEPYTETSRHDLLTHLHPREAVLERYVRRRSPWIEALRQRKVHLRDDLLARVRDQSIASLLGVDPEEAMQRAFHHTRLTGDDGGADLAPDASSGVHPIESLLPELLRLASEHGTRLAFLRPPDAPWTPATRRDPTPPALVAAVASLVVERGHAWLDLYDARLQARDFSNARHLTPEGAERLTALAGPALAAQWDEVRPSR